MSEQTFYLEIEGVSEADAGIYAKELANTLLDASQDIKVTVERKDARSMDFGSILGVVLGAPAIIIAAKAMRDWLVQRHSASLTIKDGKHEVIATNVTSKDVLSLVDKLKKYK